MWHVWVRGEVRTGFWWGDLRESDHLKDLGIALSIILKWMFKTWDGGVDWIAVAQDRVRWLALVKEVMKVQVP
jgi:hypothetical protein